MNFANGNTPNELFSAVLFYVKAFIICFLGKVLLALENAILGQILFDFYKVKTVHLIRFSRSFLANNFFIRRQLALCIDDRNNTKITWTSIFFLFYNLFLLIFDLSEVPDVFYSIIRILIEHVPTGSTCPCW